jgi:hypothetical protein
MESGYQLIALADAGPGMVLSEVLLDRVGQVLLPKGAVLTSAVIASLERHGVGMLPVVVSQLPLAEPEQVHARLDQIFRLACSDANDNAAAGVLRCYMESYRLGKEVAP